MKIFQPQAMYQIGKRDNQEDAIFPILGNATENDRLFIVCDGMGGHDSGEVASNSICQNISYFLKDANPDTFSSEDFNKALGYAYDKLDSLDQDTNSFRKMGTTLAFLYLGNNNVIIAHIGDSRVYHLRRHKKGTISILHRTEDHSLVNEMVSQGIISEDEALVHPRRNVITRAIQPNTPNRCKADIYETSDVKVDDYFFICSDGVLESIEDKDLIKILESKSSDEAMMKKIQTICNKNSRDNHSAYLIHVKEGLALEPTYNEITETKITNKPVMERIQQETQQIKSSSNDNSSSSAMVLVMAALFIAILGVGIWGAINFLELNNDMSTFAKNRKITPEEANSPFYKGEASDTIASYDKNLKNEPEYFKALSSQERADVIYLKNNNRWNKAMIKSNKFRQVYNDLANGNISALRQCFAGYSRQHINYYLQAIFQKNINTTKLYDALDRASNDGVIDLKSLNYALLNSNKEKKENKSAETDNESASDSDKKSSESTSTTKDDAPTTAPEAKPTPKKETPAPNTEPTPKKEEPAAKAEPSPKAAPTPSSQPEPTNNIFD